MDIVLGSKEPKGPILWFWTLEVQLDPPLGAVMFFLMLVLPSMVMVIEKAYIYSRV